MGLAHDPNTSFGRDAGTHYDDEEIPEEVRAETYAAGIIPARTPDSGEAYPQYSSCADLQAAEPCMH